MAGNNFAGTGTNTIYADCAGSGEQNLSKLRLLLSFVIFWKKIFQYIKNYESKKSSHLKNKDLKFLIKFTLSFSYFFNF